MSADIAHVARRQHPTAIILPLVVNRSTDSEGTRGEEGTRHLRAPLHECVATDLETAYRIDPGLIAGQIISLVRIVLLLKHRELHHIVGH